MSVNNYSVGILNALNSSNNKGLCSPFANLFACYRMGNCNRDFLDPKKSYDLAVKMQEHQDQVAKQIEDKELGALVSLHVAFFDKKLLFKATRETVDQLSKPEGVKSILDDSEHALVNYPTEPEQYHQVYLGKDPVSSECVFFDSSMPGSEKEGLCDQIFDIFAASIKENASKDGRSCLFARSIVQGV